MTAQKRCAEPSGLHRVLGLAFGLAIGFGGIVGGGLLKTSGLVAALAPEPWLLIALWSACSLHSFLGANVVAELMAALPHDGGLFVVARRAFGDFGGLVVGWADAAQNCAAIAAVAILSVSFAAMLLPALSAYTVALAIGVQIFFLAINLLGVREGSMVQQATAVVKALMLAAIIVALVASAGSREHALTTPATVTAAAAVTAYQMIYGAYSGWTNPGYFGDESTEAERNIPRAIFGSIAAASIVYIGFNAGLVAAVNVQVLGHSDFAAADVVGRVFGHNGTSVVIFIAMVLVFSSTNGLVLLTPRILYGLGRDGLFFRWASRVNRGGTPHWATVSAVAIGIALTLSGSFETVFLLMGAMTLFTMVATDIAYFVLRHREPNLPRPYKARWHPVLPLLLLVIDFALFTAMLWADPFGAFAMIAMLMVALPVSGVLHLLRRRESRAATA